MAILYSQSFTAADATLVSALSPDVGVGALTATSFVVTSNRARGTGTSGSMATPTISTADYVVKATVRLLANTGTPSLTVMGRASAAGPINDRYNILCNQASGLVLRKTVGAANTDLGTHSMTWTLNQDYDVWLVVNGSAISAWLDGTQVIAPVTDTSHTAAGVAAIGYGMSVSGTSADGWHIDQFDVDDAFPPYGATGTPFRPYYITG